MKYCNNIYFQRFYMQQRIFEEYKIAGWKPTEIAGKMATLGFPCDKSTVMRVLLRSTTRNTKTSEILLSV